MGYSYNSPRYKRWRDKVFRRDHYTCQLCGDKGTLNAHHIKKKSRYPSLAHRVQNGITLCYKCHNAITKHEELFEPLFFRITLKKLTMEFIYKFFYDLTKNNKAIVKTLKDNGKWLKIPTALAGIVSHENTKK